MKKLLLLLFIIMFMCGCDISYNLNITKDFKFTEEIVINGDIYKYFGKADKEFVNEYFESALPSNGIYSIDKVDVDYNDFNVKIISDINGIESFLKADSLLSFYNDNNISKENNNYIFKFSRIEEIEDEAYTPLEFDSFQVVIYSEKKIINSNADKISFNKYIWNMKDSKIKDIYFELTDENAIVIKPIVWIISGVSVAIIIIFIIIRKSQKNNEI